MIQFLLFILVFFLVFAIVIFGVATKFLSWIIRTIRNLFFGTSNYNAGDKANRQSQSSSRPQQSKKIFQKDEGEYVDYEKI
ncbi:MAG: DUF4834 family protein [Bacteroidaceae bacterium]|nr:DUF4834 family protein [Bacteroidaceae bacterium]